MVKLCKLIKQIEIKLEQMDSPILIALILLSQHCIINVEMNESAEILKRMHWTGDYILCLGIDNSGTM